MVLKHILEIYDVLDDPSASGQRVLELFKNFDNVETTLETVQGENGSTDCITIKIKGKNPNAKKLGVIGRLGGIGARPSVTGFVSDGDGALTALSVGLKIADMNQKGDILEGDVIIATHICPSAPVAPHNPVPFMGSPIDMEINNEHEVLPEMGAILSIDTTKGNRVINLNGFAISSTLKEGYILEVSNDLMDIYTRTTGKLPSIMPVCQQDLTPYGNDLHHVNSIFQPVCATNSPVVGVAITTEQMIAGCASGATHFEDIEACARFCVEVAKYYTQNKCSFYNEHEFKHLVELYGTMNHFQKKDGSNVKIGVVQKKII